MINIRPSLEADFDETECCSTCVYIFVCVFLCVFREGWLSKKSIILFYSYGVVARRQLPS